MFKQDCEEQWKQISHLFGVEGVRDIFLEALETELQKPGVRLTPLASAANVKWDERRSKRNWKCKRKEEGERESRKEKEGRGRRGMGSGRSRGRGGK